MPNSLSNFPKYKYPNPPKYDEKYTFTIKINNIIVINMKIESVLSPFLNITI